MLGNRRGTGDADTSRGDGAQAQARRQRERLIVRLWAVTSISKMVETREPLPDARRALRSRPPPFESDLIVFFWRRDLLSAPRSLPNRRGHCRAPAYSIGWHPPLEDVDTRHGDVDQRRARARIAP